MLTGLAVDARRNVVALSETLGRAQLWDLNRGTIEPLPAPRDVQAFEGIAFSADGLRVIAAGARTDGNGLIAEWDVSRRPFVLSTSSTYSAGEQPTMQISGKSQSIAEPVIAPGGRLMAEVRPVCSRSGISKPEPA